jgi:hypothetical protein
VTDVPQRASSNRRLINAHCARHGGTPGLTNLVVSKRDGEIELDPHVDRSCVITLDEPGATVLRDALTEWLG